jgi:hypothetical protein
VAQFLRTYCYFFFFFFFLCLKVLFFNPHNINQLTLMEGMVIDHCRCTLLKSVTHTRVRGEFADDNNHLVDVVVF